MMSKTYPENPAFVTVPDGNGTGLTKREYFAAMAMQGLLGNGYLMQKLGEQALSDGVDDIGPQLIDMASTSADQLIAQLNGDQE